MGRLLVIDGLDGSGKATQARILAEKFKQRKVKFKLIDYPNYDSEAGALIKFYLAGGISKNLFDVNSFAASSFFACDHYTHYITNWKAQYDQGYLILANRYVSSNAIHQMAKLSKIEWNDFLNWLIDFEFAKLGLPRQNNLIYLDFLPEISQKLIANRNERLKQKSDLHEQNLNYLIRCREAAFFCAKKFGWEVVSCFLQNEPLSVEEIAKMVENLALEFLN